MSNNITKPIPGTDAYWQQRQQAFALIQALEKAIAERNRAPIYIAGPHYGPEENGDDVVENVGPWDRVCALQDRARENPVVMETLTAQNRLGLLTV